MKRYDYPNRTYINILVNGKITLEHRYVWTQAHGEIPKGMNIHHINSNTKDNRLENLALVTEAQNKQKMDRAGKGYRYRSKKARPYEATRRFNNKQTYLGSFSTPCGAYMASRMFFVTHKHRGHSLPSPERV